MKLKLYNDIEIVDGKTAYSKSFTSKEERDQYIEDHRLKGHEIPIVKGEDYINITTIVLKNNEKNVNN